ncbi:hypothetical protein MLD38_009392 [Melastoma candidum]|uniref:Uncharacterized protein n=1 Tax=Melastoma candidum TaxID=119954 RepID=A0ACB9S0F8_9MYRT|nr:hypothetical protein MLD38_009392 [Melastoma candidum]
MNMGESACLRRSFSNPSSSSSSFPEFNQGGDPLRALTESVSFGRFVSEPLHWEKWSAFSSNRYLEEAERFSKPGSVAQMRAFFEAHYRRKAAPAARPTTPLIEEPVAVVDYSGENDRQEQEVAPADSVEIDSAGEVCVEVESGVVDENNSRVVLAEPAESKDDDLLAHDAHVCDVQPIADKEEARHESTNVLPDDVAADRHCLDSFEEKELKSLATASKPGQTSNSRVTKVRAASKPKISNGAAVDGRNSSLKRTEEKRLAPRLLHMSLNPVPPGGLSQAWKTRGSKFLPALKEISGPASIENKPKVPQRAAPPQLASAPSSDIKRTVSMLSKSMTALMRMKTDKKPSPLHTSHSKCSAEAESRARPATVFTAFGLRSAERAEKRKEFFLKQQERTIAKEAEKGQLMHRRQPSLARSQPRSPKSRNNPSHNKGPDGRSLPPWQISTAAETTHPVNSKASRRPATYIESHTKKHIQENKSPNIPV